MRQSGEGMDAEFGLLFTKRAPKDDTGPSCAVDVCIMNNIILTLGSLFSLMAVAPAFSAVFPLGANDFDAWKEATAQAMEPDFLTTTSQDVRALFGEPRTVGDSEHDNTLSIPIIVRTICPGCSVCDRSILRINASASGFSWSLSFIKRTTG